MRRLSSFDFRLSVDAFRRFRKPKVCFSISESITVAILERLLALNAERAEEEANGRIRWLRPDFQAPHEGTQGGLNMDREDAPDAETGKPSTRAPAKQPWPKTLPEQTKAVRTALMLLPNPVTVDDIARRFRNADAVRIADILESLEAVGLATGEDGAYSLK